MFTDGWQELHSVTSWAQLFGKIPRHVEDYFTSQVRVRISSKMILARSLTEAR